MKAIPIRSNFIGPNVTQQLFQKAGNKKKYQKCKLGNCDICEEEKNLFIWSWMIWNETKFGLDWTFEFKKPFELYQQTSMRVIMRVSKNFIQFGWNWQKKMKFSQYLAKFSIKFSKTYQKSFSLLQN